MANFNQPGGGVIYPNYNGTSGITSGTNATAYPVQYPLPPANWANFPCGHQMKLEPGQPYPSRCQVCPAPEQAHHEYKKCGHVFNYQTGQQVPAECPTCRYEREKEAKAIEELRAQAEAEAEQRALEDKDPLAWLDKQLTAVREVAFA